MPLLRTVVLSSILCMQAAVLGFAAGTDGKNYRISQEPGVYNRDLQLTVSSEDNTELSYSIAPADRWIPVARGISLQAMDGETRAYTVKLKATSASGDGAKIETFDYVIDKTPPEAPEPLQFPGTAFEALKLVFSVRDNLAGTQVVYNLTASDGTQVRNKTGNEISIEGRAGQSVSYRVDVASVDAAGNSSPFKTYTYVIDRKRERATDEILVYSPVEGRFQNQQFLYLDDQFLQDVRYTTDGTDPAINGTKYSDGVLLPATGKVQLRLWARSYAGNEIRKTVNYESGAEDIGNIRSTVITGQAVVDAQTAGYRYVAGERKANESDEILDRPLRISPQTGSLRGIAIRLLRVSDSTEFRYYFVLDGRIPAKPELWLQTADPVDGHLVSVDNGDAVSSTVELRAKTGAGVRMFYTVSGLSPQESGGSPISDDAVKIPVDSAKKSDLVISLQARRGDGNWGPVNKVTLKPYALPKPADAGIVVVSENEISFSKVESGVPAWVVINSPFHQSVQGPFRVTGDNEFSLPFGAQGDIEFRTAYGNRLALSPWSAPQKVTVKNLPPREPQISVDDKTVVVTGEAQIMYRISSTPDGGPSNTAEFVNYKGPITLQPDTGNNLSYVLEAFSVDKNGNRSPLSVSRPIALLTRAPLGAKVANRSDGTYWNKTEGDIVIEKPETGVRYYYTLGATASDPDPTRDPFSEKTIHLTLPVDAAKKDRDQRFVLSILPVSEFDGSAKGSINRIEITYDITPPGTPLVSGIVQGGSYRDSVSISIRPDSGEFAEYRIRKAGTQSPGPSDSYISYTDPVVVDTPEGTEASFLFEARVFDKAANESDLSAPIDFSIDKQAPAVPVLVAGDQGATPVDSQQSFVSNENQAFRIVAADDTTIFFELAESERATKLVTPQSSRYQGTIPIPEVKDDEDKTFSLQAIAVDAAGNQSAVSPIYRVRIDRRKPADPGEPRVVRNLNEGELIWDNQTDATIEIAAVGADGTVTDGFKPAASVTSWSMQSDQNELIFAYRAVDEAGNRSQTRQLTISRRTQAAMASLNGVSDGGIYNAPIKIVPKPDSPQGIIRYELLTKGQVGNGVDSTSPALPDEGLEVTPLPGESLDYVLLTRQFSDNSEPSAELRISFTIDRSPPSPPRLAGAQRLNYIANPQTLKLEGNEGEDLFYAVVSESQPFTSQTVATADTVAMDKLGEKGFATGTDEIRLGAIDTGVMHYLVGAYAVDKAGNKSNQVQIWEFYVDTQTVYVVDAGMIVRGNVESGSRGQPFGDLDKAVSFAIAQKRTNIVVSSGNFPLKKTLQLSSSLSISGGYDSKEWKQSSDQQTILYPAQTLPGALLVAGAGTELQLRNLFVIDGGMKVASLLRVEAALVKISGGSMAVTASPNAIVSIDGNITINATSISCNDPAAVTLISAKGGKLSMSSSLIESADLPPVLLKRSQNADYVLVELSGTDVTLQDTTILPRKGLQTVGLRITGGSAAIDGGEIRTGQGSQLALGIDITNTTLSIKSTRLLGDRLARTSAILRSSGSTADFDGVVMTVAAQNGAYGAIAGNSRFSVSRSSLQSEASNEFVTIFSLDNSDFKFEQNTSVMTATKDFQFLSLREGDSDIHGNNVRITGTSSSSRSVINLNGHGNHKIEDNVFTGDDQSILMYLGSSQTNITLRANVLERWRLLLQVSQENPVRQSDNLKGFSTIDELESLDRKGSFFEGNRVRQGL